MQATQVLLTRIVQLTNTSKPAAYATQAKERLSSQPPRCVVRRCMRIEGEILRKTQCPFGLCAICRNEVGFLWIGGESPVSLLEECDSALVVISMLVVYSIVASAGSLDECSRFVGYCVEQCSRFRQDRRESLQVAS